MGAHDALAERILAAITEKGATVTFLGASDTEPVYDPATDTWVVPEGEGNVTGKAVKTKGDPDKLAKLVLKNPIALMVAGKDLGVVPEPPMPFEFAGKRYVTRLADAHGPDGAPMYYEVIGDA